MRKIAILAATHAELEPVKDKWEREVTGKLLEYYTVQFIVAGIGAVSAGISCMEVIKETKPDLLIWIGIAGSYDKRLELGQVVEVIDDLQADLVIQESDGSYIEISPLDDYPGSAKPTARFHADPVVDHRFEKVSGLTVQTVTGTSRDAQRLRNRFACQVETMEGAGYLMACIRSDQPCLHLRSISNYVEARDRSRWRIKLALESLANALFQLLSTKII
ncbi:MAG: futalosine hydrolase [Saprospiraceae bacterium]|nr:futalosine hydrolase [Saprospiraceae bacterium]